MEVTDEWEKIIVTWLNCVNNSSPIKTISQINDRYLENTIKTLKPDFSEGSNKFFTTVFQNLSENENHLGSSNHDNLWKSTLLLIYSSFSNEPELENIKEIMCTKLDNDSQIEITQFLMSLQEQQDVFNISLKNLKEEIFSFCKKKNFSSVVAGHQTPVKNNTPNSSFNSPLQGFFQTPKRNRPVRPSKGSSGMCGDGDPSKLIKKLTNQLVEEESEKEKFQENLLKQIQKCNEYEIKLKNKIEEINNLKSEWENESRRNEAEIQSLKDAILKKSQNESKMKSEIGDLEKYVSTLDKDLSNNLAQKDKLEYQLKQSLEKCNTYELQLKEATELNMQLEYIIQNKEKELAELGDYVKAYKEEKNVDVSLLDRSIDKSVSSPENMGVVVDMLLNDKIAENTSLQEMIEQLQKEKNKLQSEIDKLKQQSNQKLSVISELQYLNKELALKVESFEENEKEFLKVQEKLLTANAEISRLLAENSHLTERFNISNNKVMESEKALRNCKNSKMLLYTNFLQLSEDMKVLQNFLPSEMKNISRFTLSPDDFCNESKSGNEAVKENTGDTSCSSEGNEAQVSSSENDSFDKIKELCQEFGKKKLEWSKYKNSMEETCKELNDKIIELKRKVKDFEDIQVKYLEEKNQLESQLKASNERISEIQTLHLFQMKTLREEFEKKECKIIELENLILEMKSTQEKLKVENDSLKKENLKNKESSLTFVYEGGDFNKAQKHTSENIKISREQEADDSLEELPVCSKTFDIVNLEEKNIIDKTFSVQKESVERGTSSNNYSSVWVLSPPSKAPPKVAPVKQTEKPRRSQAEAWVVPLPLAKSKTSVSKKVSSANDFVAKPNPVRILSNSRLTKSSSLSSILENDYSLPSKAESKASAASSFFSSTDLRSNNGKEEVMQGVRVKKFASLNSSETQKVKNLENHPPGNFRLTERNEEPLKEIFDRNVKSDVRARNYDYEVIIADLQRKADEFSKENERLRFELLESEKKRKKDRDTFEKNQDVIRQNIAAKYEAQLEHLKNEMKLLHNTELSKHKAEVSKLNVELRDQNKRYKEHIDELRNQLWDLGEKLLQEQMMKRDLERNYNELKKKFEGLVYCRDIDMKNSYGSKIHSKDSLSDENFRVHGGRQIPNATFPMPTEDEEEVFDNRFLEDMKQGVCREENPEGRLMELQYRNSLCLPHLKSSYPGETQFQNPALFKENDIKLGLLQFGQESQSLTDSDHSMTKSLIPENKGKKKEQTSYKKPGPPTPSKNGGRLSLQSGDLRDTPRNVLKEINDQSERSKATPNPFKNLLSKNIKHGSLVIKDENTAPVTPRKKSKFFRKPFGARDH